MENKIEFLEDTFLIITKRKLIVFKCFYFKDFQKRICATVTTIKQNGDKRFMTYETRDIDSLFRFIETDLVNICTDWSSNLDQNTGFYRANLLKYLDNCKD